MNEPHADRTLREEIYQLTEGCLRGDLNEAEWAHLDQLLRHDPGAVNHYTDYLAESLALRNMAESARSDASVGGARSAPAGDLFDQIIRAPKHPGLPAARRTPFGLWGGLFTAAMLVVIFTLLFRLSAPVAPPDAPQSAQHVQVVASTNALWDRYSAPDADGWLPDGNIILHHGQVELHFSTGVVAVLRGPAHIRVHSAEEIDLTHGSLTARVDGSTMAFRVRTPTSEVVDLGTEFGITVPLSGETAVAVFDGRVDVRSSADANGDTASSSRRLAAGEAIRIDWQGQFRRITTVTDDLFPVLPGTRTEPPREPLILSVDDNLRDEDDSSKFYRIVPRGFGEDARAYVDRAHEWNGVDASGMPEFLIGADYIMTFNDDKRVGDLEIVVTLAQPATVYVLMDDRAQAPDWLQESFTDTGLKIGMDEDGSSYPQPRKDRPYKTGIGPGVNVDFVFSIWERPVTQPGPVVLGSLLRSNQQSMYGIVVAPLDAATR